MRRSTRRIHVGSVAVGKGAPVSIQTMAKADTTAVEVVTAQLRKARFAGCDIARVAIDRIEAATCLRAIREGAGLPLVADIQFDHRLAVAAAQAGADGLRINPGNLGRDGLRAVVDAAGQAGIPIRIGVNAGSLPARLRKTDRVEAMVDLACNWVEQIEALGLTRIKVSLKSSSADVTAAANRMFARRSDVPLHLGLTEAGPLLTGAIRSSVVLGRLLQDGFGDTLRISLSAPPVDEVRAARALLQIVGLRTGPWVVSCPTCGRCKADLFAVAERVEQFLEAAGVNRVVAVMGCEVNGPEEARTADLGIALGSGGRGVLFQAGRRLARMPNEQLESALFERLEKLKQEIGNEG